MSPAEVAFLHEPPPGVIVGYKTVLVDPSYPTADHPNYFLGFVENAYYYSDDKGVPIAQKEAAAHGANAILKLEQNGTAFVALRLSNAPPHLPPASTLVDELVKPVVGLSQVTAPIEGEIRKGVRIQFQGHRGECYWFASVLEQEPSTEHQGGVSFKTDSPTMNAVTHPPRSVEALVPRPNGRGDPDKLFRRASLDPIACGTADAELEFLYDGDAPGSVAVQVFKSSISEPELHTAEREVAALRERKAAQDAARDRKKEILCTVCAGAASRCQRTNPHTDCTEYDACMEEHDPQHEFAEACLR